MDHLDRRRTARALVGELGGDTLLVTHQEDAVTFGGRDDGGPHRGGRRVVTAHTIEGDDRCGRRGDLPLDLDDRATAVVAADAAHAV